MASNGRKKGDKDTGRVESYIISHGRSNKFGELFVVCNNRSTHRQKICDESQKRTHQLLAIRRHSQISRVSYFAGFTCHRHTRKPRLTSLMDDAKHDIIWYQCCSPPGNQPSTCHSSTHFYRKYKNAYSY